MFGYSYIQIFAQLIGFVAFALGIAAFLSRDDRKFKILLTAQSFILSVHFFLLGANGGAVAGAVNGTRNFTSLFGRMGILAPVFIIFYFVFGIYRYGHWIDVLPITGSAISTIGLFYFSGIPMRLCTLFSTSLWIVHNFVVGSIGPFVMEVFIFTANIRTIYSLYRVQQGSLAQGE